MPHFLVLYDAQAKKAYWLYTQEYFKSHHPKGNARTMRLHIPIVNEFDNGTVQYMRGRKQSILSQIQGQINHEK